MSLLEEEHENDVKRIRKLFIVTITLIAIFTVLVIIGVLLHRTEFYMGFSILDGVSLLFLLLVGFEKMELSYQDH